MAGGRGSARPSGRGGWLVALRSDPATPLVSVGFRRPWYFPLLGRVVTRAAEGRGAAWVPVVTWAIADAQAGPTRRLLERGWAPAARHVEAGVRHLVATTPALVAWWGGPAGDAPPPLPPPAMGVIPVHWLRRRLDDDDEIREAVAQWPALARLRRPGDEVWWFESFDASWERLTGRAGYALVADGVPHQAHVTKTS